MTRTGEISVFMDEDTILAKIEWRGTQYRRYMKHNNSQPKRDLAAILDAVKQDILQVEGA